MRQTSSNTCGLIALGWCKNVKGINRGRSLLSLLLKMLVVGVPAA